MSLPDLASGYALVDLSVEWEHSAPARLGEGWASARDLADTASSVLTQDFRAALSVIPRPALLSPAA